VKPSLYIETTIISYLVGWLSRHDLYVASSQEFTRQWWAERRGAFDLYASTVVVAEAADGDPELAAERLRFLEGVSLLDVTDEAEDLKAAILRGGGIPPKAEIDALHIAIAAVNGMDYFLLRGIAGTSRTLHFAEGLCCVPARRLRTAVRMHSARADRKVTHE
jgi:hypothetical protein